MGAINSAHEFELSFYLRLNEAQTSEDLQPCVSLSIIYLVFEMLGFGDRRSLLLG